MKRKNLIVPVLTFAFLLQGCAGNGEKNQSTENNTEKPKQNESDSATMLVDLKDSKGQTTGTAELSETNDGVNIHVKAENLPEGAHGIHFHEKGVCEGPDFESAGGHFNPDKKDHGLNEENGPHAGDLPNLVVGKGGTVDDEFLSKNVTLTSGKPSSLVKDSGTALVIHANEDDGKTQPSGDSGNRISCGVIE